MSWKKCNGYTDDCDGIATMGNLCFLCANRRKSDAEKVNKILADAVAARRPLPFSISRVEIIDDE